MVFRPRRIGCRARIVRLLLRHEVLLDQRLEPLIAARGIVCIDARGFHVGPRLADLLRPATRLQARDGLLLRCQLRLL